jgi:hypothetical protein
MTPRTPHTQPEAEDARRWIGGEATIGSQAEHHVRQREGRADGLFPTILALTFIGGLALGGVISWFCRTDTK